MDAPPEREMKAVAHEWLDAYEQAGIDLVSAYGNLPSDDWDRRVSELIQRHGPAPFARLDVWPPGIEHPRGRRDRFGLRLLAATQPWAASPIVRAVQRVVRPLGW
jgi:hypothetical protein